MEKSQMVKYGKGLNLALIVLTLIVFVTYNILNILPVNDYASMVKRYEFFLVYSRILKVLFALVLIASAVLWWNSKNKMKGMGFLFAASVAAFIFIMLDSMIGIIIIMLCIKSMKDLAFGDGAKTFEERLNNEKTSPEIQ